MRCLLLPLLLFPALALPGCGGSDLAAQSSRAPATPPNARPAAPVRVGGAPVGVAVGEGGVWVLDQARARLTRHDPESGRRSGRPAQVGTSPITLAVGEGSVWVLDGADGVQRVDASTGRPSGDPVAVPDPNGIAVGAGAVWVTSRAGRSVTRIDAATLRRDPPIKVGPGPADIVFAEGGLWVAEADAGSVSRIDARTGKISKPLRLAQGQVLALAAGDGALFAAVSKNELNDEIQLVRIDPKTAKVTGAAIPVAGGVPLQLAAGRGSVWLTDVGSSLPGSPGRAPALLRIDHRRGSAVPVVKMTGRPSSVAAVSGAVWVTDSTSGTLTRVALGR